MKHLIMQWRVIGINGPFNQVVAVSCRCQQISLLCQWSCIWGGDSLSGPFKSVKVSCFACYPSGPSGSPSQAWGHYLGTHTPATTVQPQLIGCLALMQ